MKLKLDLHPIFNDSDRIERALHEIIDQAAALKAEEVEIIPGKGSGQLKKSVLRFLDRPEIKQKYHRIDKDSDNFGRLFVYFRHDKSQNANGSSVRKAPATQNATCSCCQASFAIALPEEPETFRIERECPACGTPLEIRGVPARGGKWHLDVYLNY
jgi:Smr domain